MTTELWPVGTWVADTKNGDVFRVIDPIDGQAILEKILNGFVAGLRRIDSKDGFAELPPIPDEKTLAHQGYRLTGMAADCSDWTEGVRFVSVDEMHVCRLLGASDAFNGWRWLVERIETDIDASEQRIQDSEQEYLASVESPWIDASERTPEGDHTRLIRLSFGIGLPDEVRYFTGNFSVTLGWLLWTPTNTAVQLSEWGYKDPSRIQWMEIPE